jgi:RNA polymerase sigma-70 factor (ECF subfamily)
VEELERLVERAREGDLDAFGRIVRRFQDMDYGCAYAMVGDFHLAQDVAQEAFLEAYRSLGNLWAPQGSLALGSLSTRMPCIARITHAL